MELEKLTGPARHVIQNLQRMLSIAWEMDRRLTLWYYGTAATAAVTTLLISVALKYLIDGLVRTEHFTTGFIPAVILIALAARYLLSLASEVLRWGLNNLYFDYLFRYKLQNYLSLTFYRKVSGLDIAHLEDPKTQDLITKVRDTMMWRPADFLRFFSYLVNGLVAFIAAFFVLLPFSWWIPVVISLSVIPLLILRAKFGSIQWSIYGSGAPEVKKLWYFNWILSTKTTIQEMRIFRSAPALLTRVNEIQEYLFRLNKKPLDRYIKILIWPGVFETAILAVIAYSQLPNVLSGALTIGSFTLLINMMDSLQGNAESAVLNFGELYTNGLYVDHYFEVLHLKPIITDKRNAHTFEKITPPRIEFKNVSFTYPNGTDALKDVSFTIEPGENIALVGENGAGKSTIIKLLCRFYDATDGTILVNGVNVKDIKLSHWYDFLGTLFQDFVQYHFTVRENITLGDPNKENEKEMIAAAKKSGAYQFIEKLPQGFDTVLGREFENGEELSIGQWQRLAIARAFYEEAPVLILDEPTSAIDAEAEYEIFTNLEKAYKKKTLILVSHRFSTVRNADTIFVVDKGRITERGSHGELMQANGKYARMFSTQAKGYL
ncbi:MAG: ABC transporter ATP-binding protein [Candidatus Sungbacteria bacterium]|nr:ABC transporter ATP-binding protein [Candidatus Sungbacteria bacterium]